MLGFCGDMGNSGGLNGENVKYKMNTKKLNIKNVFLV